MPSFFSQEESGKVGRESGDLCRSKPSVMALGSAFGLLGTVLTVPAVIVVTILVGELRLEWLEKEDERVDDKEERGEG